MRILFLILVLLPPLQAQEPTPPRWQVFVLVGQSNMEGKGRAEHLEVLCAGEDGARYEHLVAADGWEHRDDVFVHYLERRGPLTVGYGSSTDQFGPELQLGHVLGDRFDDPVLLIKLAWGGKSLAADFRPPSAGGDVGPYYLEVVGRTKQVLGELETLFPEVEARGHDLRGLVWFQGWNDRVNQAYNDAYGVNLTHLVRDLRAALGDPELPLVIGESGQGGPGETHPRALAMMDQQRIVAAMPEFAGSVGFVPTRHIWHEEPRFDGAYHWFGNARNFLELGDALGHGMLALLGEEPGPPPPNVVLVMTDDQGWGDVGYHGHPHLLTPHLDELASAGVRLERFYSAAPVCSPTRGSVLTGRHPARYGIDGANDGHLPRAETSLAELCAARGYTTGFFGKWHLGTLTRELIDSNRGGREKHAAHYSPPWEHGFHVVFATEAKVPTWDPMLKPGTEAPYGTAYWTGPGLRVPDEELRGDDSALVMDRALQFMRSAAEAGRPFLSVVWLHAPHEPVIAGPEYLARYPDVGDEQARHFYGCVSAVDDQIGRLRGALRELGLAEDTLLVFCSDNGPEHRAGPGSTAGLRGRKRDLLEGGVRVPAILEWPRRVAGGREFRGPASTVDLLPTVMEALGVEALPAYLDGSSLLPRLRDGDAEPVGYGFRSNERRAFHLGRYKLHSTDAGETWSLFDLEADPAESRDLAASEPRRLYELLGAFERWQADVLRDREDAPEASR